MNSQEEIGGKGAQGRTVSKNIPVGSNAKGQKPKKGKKEKYKGRYRKKGPRLCRKKGTAHARHSVKTGNEASKSHSDAQEGIATQVEDDTLVFDKKTQVNVLENKDSSSGFVDINKEIKCENPEQKVSNLDEVEDSYLESEVKAETMEASSQSGDQKNKLLEMMSREFNSASIQEGTGTFESRKSARVPRLTRKRKSEVIDTPEKSSETTVNQPTPITTVTPIIHNPITSALKKIRKESLENLPLPTSPTLPGRTRRSTQERKSGSEKDSGEEAAGISEVPEVTESKTEEGLAHERTTPDTRGRKRARARGKSVIEGEEGNDSGNESPIIPVKGRGKTHSSSEEDSLIANSDSPCSSKSRVRSTKGLGEGEAPGMAAQIKGKGKVPVKEEPLSDIKGRGKVKAEGEKTEDQLNTVLGSGKSQSKIKPPCEDTGNAVTTSNGSVVTMSTRSRGKTESEKEGTLETEPLSQPRRSMTPVSGDSTPQSELKRSQRILLSREGSSDISPLCKRGTPKPTPEVIKKQDTPTPPAKPPPFKQRKEEIALTKTGKKKKKHFKGLSYSFSTRKKKGKAKFNQGKHSLDTSQESDSVVSEEIDMESVDSSSQDVPSEQLSNQDQDGGDDRLSDGGENDVEMDNVETPDPSADDDGVRDCILEKISADLANSDENAESLKDAKKEVVEEEKSTDVCDKFDKAIKSELLEEEKDDIEKINYLDSKEEERKLVGLKESEVSGGSTFAKSDASATSSEGAVDVESSSSLEAVKPENIESQSKVKSHRDTEVKCGAGKSNQTEILGKGMRTKRAPPGVPVYSSQRKEVNPVIRKQVTEKEHSTSPSKILSTPEMGCSASESAFSPGAEVEVQVPEEDGGEALSKRPEEVASNKNGAGGTNQSGDKSENSPQIPALSNKLQGAEAAELPCQPSKETIALQDEGLRQPRRRHSISKRKMDDLVPEGHNSDSSDSLGEARMPGEGVRKSKRLSRHSSPHGLSFAAPESPEGPGKSQSKPISSRSAYVILGPQTPDSPGEHHCYIPSPPVNLSCHQQGNVQSAAPTLTNVLCKCRIKYNPLAIVTTGEVYCQAIDSFDGRMIGCCNIVTNYRLLRVSGKIPFMLLCDNHRQRLRRHNCCPCCGLFCTQGVFYECSWDKGRLRHYYHKLCSLVLNGTNLCPHCGSSETPQEVQLELTLARKPVVYLKQHQERKESSARMTWSKGDNPEDGAGVDVAAEKEPSLELRNGRVISAQKLPFGCGREKLQEAIRCINEGKAVNIKSSSKGIYAACKQNDIEKLLHALVTGLSPNVKVKECGSQTGLHVAAAFGSVAALHILVMAGATIDMTDTQLMTPLMIAITKEQNDVVHYLVQAGASLMAKTQDGMTCLHLAAKCGNLIACQHILESGRLTRHAINMQDEGGWTPLVWASENKFTTVVKFLLDRGGNPQLCDVEQNTALHWAAYSGSTEICSMVLDRGCSLRSMNAHGDTPLHIATRQNHTDAVVLLLTRGAQLDVLNSKNQMPIDCALADSDVYLQLTLNSKVLEIMKQNNIRTEKILSSDIAGGKEEVPIPCVNGVDEELLPKDYLYIAENCEASNVTIDRTITSLKWCECEDGCNAEHCGCGQLNFQCWFDPDGRLLPEFNYADPPMIFECNRACRCNKLSCNNRVVQHGISAHMQLFKTVGKGWGVRALKTIQKGSYVCEYVGEIITDLEADQRQDDSYLFDLDNRDSETFCIDARSYGNIARFINHLCEANLTPVKVFIDHQDLTFPRIAFFANRDIEADEELGFDYGEKFWMIKYKQFTCTCSSEKCKYSSETIQTTLENYNRKLRELQETM